MRAKTISEMYSARGVRAITWTCMPWTSKNLGWSGSCAGSPSSSPCNPSGGKACRGSLSPCTNRIKKLDQVWLLLYQSMSRKKEPVPNFDESSKHLCFYPFQLFLYCCICFTISTLGRGSACPAPYPCLSVWKDSARASSDINVPSRRSTWRLLQSVAVLSKNRILVQSPFQQDLRSARESAFGARRNWTFY